MELFRRITEDFATFESGELRELVAEYRATIARLAQRDPDLTADMTDADLLAHAQEGTEAVLRIDALITECDQATAATDATLADLAAQAGAVDTDEDDTDGDTDADADQDTDADADADGDVVDGDVVDDTDGDDADQADDTTADSTDDAPADDAGDADAGTGTAIAASGGARAPARPRKRNRPRTDPGVRTTVVAAADVPGFPAGSEINTGEGVIEAFQSAFQGIYRMPANKAKVPVVRARTPYPTHLRLGRDAVSNEEIVKRSRADRLKVIMASGGFCAPATPIYDLPHLSVPDRPVRDSLMSFQATRGGIQFPTPMSINDITTAVGIVTNEDDELGGTNAVKGIQEYTCHDFTTVFVDAVYNRSRFGNLGAMAWPEAVADALQTANDAHARVAETNLLDAMNAIATPLTAGTVLGSVADLMDHVLRAAAGYRSRFRMRPDTVLDTWFPSWLPDMLLDDTFKTQFHRFDFDRNSIANELFSKAKVRATFYMDTPTGAGQTFAFTETGTLDAFPSTVVWFLAPQDTVGFLDGGTLDLGLVRDSATNEVNDYEMFSETFEALYFQGNKLEKITSTLAPTGAVKNPV